MITIIAEEGPKSYSLYEIYCFCSFALKQSVKNILGFVEQERKEMGIFMGKHYGKPMSYDKRLRTHGHKNSQTLKKNYWKVVGRV